MKSCRSQHRGFVVYYCLVLAIIIGFVIANSQKSPIDRSLENEFARTATQRRLAGHTIDAALEVCRQVATLSRGCSGSWEISVATEVTPLSRIATAVVSFELDEALGRVSPMRVSVKLHPNLPEFADPMQAGTFAATRDRNTMFFSASNAVQLGATSSENRLHYPVNASGSIEFSVGTETVQVQTWKSGGGVSTWSLGIGGSRADVAGGIIPVFNASCEPDGFLVYGSTQSNDTDVSGNHGTSPTYSADGWVAWLSSDTATTASLLHVASWPNCVGGNATESLTGAVQVGSGDYLLVGWSESNGNDLAGVHLRPAGNRDAWVVRLASETGRVTWGFCVGSDSTDLFRGITQVTCDPASPTYVFFGGLTSSSTRGLDGLVVGYWDPQATPTAIATFGGNLDDVFISGLLLASSDLLLVGGTLSTDLAAQSASPAARLPVPLQNIHGTSQDAWVVCVRADSLLASAAVGWQRCIGGTASDSLAAAVNHFGAESDILLAGWTESSDGDLNMIKSTTDRDAWIVRLANDASAIRWQGCFGGSGQDEFVGVRALPDGGVLLLGNTMSTNGNLTGIKSTTDRDAWVVRLASDGTIVSQHILGGNQDDTATGWTRTVDGGTVIAITASSTDLFSPNLGASDLWLVKTDRFGSPGW